MPTFHTPLDHPATPPDSAVHHIERSIDKRNMRGIIKYVFGTVLIACCLPIIETMGEYNVDVTWTIRESIPQDHRVTYQDKTLLIPAGQSARQTYLLEGGSNVALLYSVRGWGFDQSLKVAGHDILPSRSRIKRSSVHGEWKILGMARSPSMAVEIVYGPSTDNEEVEPQR